MKIVSIILLILITTFVAFPCTDSHDDAFDNHAEYSVVDCANAHSDVVPYQETCTPFCMCNCCSTQLVEEVAQIDFVLEYTITECQEHTFATIDQYIQPKVTPPKS
ncbi:MAG: hypothetical protein CVV25_07480 [Ignavibacteriae bacterium HGW-Ignavibacteriae-4]|nr:MAG: hypothetical protein CVV25_07480 [Ignavibacteriae bacterium HGW-Ignavibacteriae-4]